jgi:hypothetical protein
VEPAVREALDTNLAGLAAVGDRTHAYAVLLKQTLCMGPDRTIADWDFDAAVAGTPIAALLAELRAAGRPRQAASIAHILQSDVKPQIARRCLQLYVRGDPGAQRVMRRVLFDPEPNDTVAYLYLLLLTVGHELLGDPRIDQLMARGTGSFAPWTGVVRDIVNDPRTDEFLRTRSQPLRFYAGSTNTVVGRYDEYFDGHFARDFHRGAAFLGDLGGGFATADISRATGCRFTSIDIRSPDPFLSDPLYLPLRKWDAGRDRMLEPGERRAYLEAQRRVPWIPWDVIERRPFVELLGDHASYGFTSTGFLTSTVQPATRDGTRRDTENYHSTTLLGLKRIVELVQLGRDVSLFTVARPSNRPFHFKTALLRWQDRRLVASRFVPAPIGREWTEDQRRRILEFVLS